jgi:hypothetical protein
MKLKAAELYYLTKGTASGSDGWWPGHHKILATVDNTEVIL